MKCWNGKSSATLFNKACGGRGKKGGYHFERSSIDPRGRAARKDKKRHRRLESCDFKGKSVAQEKGALSWK